MPRYGVSEWYPSGIGLTMVASVAARAGSGETAPVGPVVARHRLPDEQHDRGGLRGRRLPGDSTGPTRAVDLRLSGAPRRCREALGPTSGRSWPRLPA